MTVNSNVLTALTHAYQRNRLSHALLIKSRPENLKELKELFALILETDDLRLDAEDRTHPDFLFVAPASEQGYTVDQVREWSSFMALKPNSSSNKILVIPDAEKLSSGTMAAANALLKVLEEPRPNNYIFLLTKQPLRLLSTIRSRVLFVNLAQKNVTEELSEDFKEIVDTLRRQAPSKNQLSQSAFWKNRGEKIQKLETELQTIWKTLRKDLVTLPREEALKRLHAWSHLEDFVWAVKHYGNASLHWLDFKMKVQESKAWKRSKLFG